MPQGFSEVHHQVKKHLQCQGCLKYKSAETEKLFACSACRQARYCSPQCQKSHWPTHKPICKSRQDTSRYLEAQNAIIKSKADETPTVGSCQPLLATELLEEIRAFTKQVRPLLGELGWSALDLLRAPEKWKDHLVYIKIDRTFPMDRDVPTWARFVASDIQCFPLSDVARLPQGINNNLQHILEQKARHDAYSASMGLLGTITTVIQGDADQGSGVPGITLCNVVCVFFKEFSDSLVKGGNPPGWREDYLRIMNAMMDDARSKTKRKKART